jgi:hypothetical protein
MLPSINPDRDFYLVYVPRALRTAVINLLESAAPPLRQDLAKIAKQLSQYTDHPDTVPL